MALISGYQSLVTNGIMWQRVPYVQLLVDLLTG